MTEETTLATVAASSDGILSEKAQTPLSSTTTNPGTIKDTIWKAIATREMLFIGLIFVLAFIVRATLMRFELFFEFDSYWHARMVSYILQGLPAPAVDPLAYYQTLSAATLGQAPYFFWYFSAAIYKLFTLNGAYNFETWVLWVKLLPALYGALTCIAMYFLGKELFRGDHEKTAGLFAGILAAVVPSFVYRTMGGFFEDDSFGFLWMIMGLVFFVRATHHPALKRENIINAVLGGVMFALMAFAWSAFNMLVPILLGVGFFQFILWLREGQLKTAQDFGILWLISFIILAIGATIQSGLFWLGQFGGILGNLFFRSSDLIQAPHVIVFLLIFIALLYGVLRLRMANKLSDTHVRKIVAVFFILLAAAPLLVTVFNVSLRTSDVLGQTVGEESDGKNYFGNKYSLMVVFALIGIPLMAYLLITRGRKYATLVLPLVWVVVVFFMAWGKLKFTYYWGLPLALTGAVVLYLALRWMLKNSITTQKLVAMACGFLLLSSVAAGVIFVTQNVPNIESSYGWKEALFWSEKNLDNNTKFFNWWDEGHWISFITGKKTLIDNRNADTKTTAEVAKFMLSTDAQDAAAIVDQFESTHLIFGNDLLEKLPNLGFYAYGITDGSDPRISGVGGFVNRCSQQTAPLTKEITYVCGSNTLSTEQINALPTTWQSTPNNLQNGTPFFVYRDAQKHWLYAFSTQANQTMLVRLWFGENEAMEEFTEIYRNDGDVRIFQRIQSSSPPPIEITDETTESEIDELIETDENTSDSNTTASTT